MKNDNQRIYELIILGAGPAGAAAGIYAARKKINTLIITENFGGQAVVAATIENIVGFKKISGIEMARLFEEQLRFQSDLDIVIEHIEKVKEDKDFFAIETSKNVYFGQNLLIALGRRYRKLNLLKEKELEGKGIFYCSTCDAPLLKNKSAAVIGGGNSALLSVIDLIPFASKIYLLTDEPFLRGDPILQERIKNEKKIEIIYNTQILEIIGEQVVSGLKFKNRQTNEEKTIEASGIFIQIGMQANSELVKNLVNLNEAGEIIVQPLSGKTSHPKIWAAGDITDLPYKQISVAIGDGVRALLDIYNKIREIKNKEFI